MKKLTKICHATIFFLIITLWFNHSAQSQPMGGPMGGGPGPGGPGGPPGAQVDQQTIDRVREDARKNPTTTANIQERVKVLRALPLILLRKGAPVGQYFPMQKFQEINSLMRSQDYTKAAPLVDAAFKNLDIAENNAQPGMAPTPPAFGQNRPQGMPPFGQGSTGQPPFGQSPPQGQQFTSGQGANGQPSFGQRPSTGGPMGPLAQAMGFQNIPGFALSSPAPVFCNISFTVRQGSNIEDMKHRLEIVKRHVSLLQKHGLHGDYYFTWLAMKQIMAIDPQFFNTLKQAGMGINHHGAKEGPPPTPLDRTHGMNWQNDVQTMRNYESHDINPQTGELIMDQPGGIKGMSEVYNLQPFATGQFFKASILDVDKEFGIKMGAGIKEDIGVPDGRGWYMGVLNRPDTIDLQPQAVIAWSLQNAPDPRTQLSQEIQQLNRKEFNLIEILLHDGDFLQRGNTADEEKMFQSFDQFLDWVEKSKDLKTVTARDIYNMAVDDRDRTVQTSQLEEMIQEQLSKAPRSSPPLYFSLRNMDYLSLADVFQALCESLSSYSKNASLPEIIRVHDILGPTANIPPSSSSSIVLSAKEIMDKAGQIKPYLSVSGVPSEIVLSNARLNAAEFLMAMEQVYQKINQGQTSANALGQVQISPQSLIPQEVDNPMRRDVFTKLQVWTYKPARWNISGLASAGAKKPVLFWIYGHHYGARYADPSVIRKFADLLVKLNLKGTFYCDGILADKIERHDPSLFAYINSLQMPIGYHGEDTHGPQPNAPRTTNNKNWEQAVEAVKERYSHAQKVVWMNSSEDWINMNASGESDFSKPGGIVAVQQAFGRDVDILTDHSLNAAPAGYAFMELTKAKMAQGTLLSYHGMGPELQHNQELLEQVFGIGGLENPLFWYMNQLNTKEIIETLLIPSNQLKEEFGKLDRSHVNFVTVLMEPDEHTGSLTDFEERLRYIKDEFIPQNPGSRFVIPQDLLNLVDSQTPPAISKKQLENICDYLLNHWSARPPNSIMIPGDRNYSLAQAFEALVNSLSAVQSTHQLPESVTVSDYLGPIGEKNELVHVSNSQISVPDILQAAGLVKQNLPESKYHSIPFQISAGNNNMNTAEFLEAMAKTYRAISSRQQTAFINVDSSDVVPPYGDILVKAVAPMDTAIWYSQLQLWTVQPIHWKYF